MDHPHPGSPNGTGDAAAWTLPDDAHIGRIVAGLLDGELKRRRPATVLHWVGAQLDIDPVRLGTHAHASSGVDFVVLATALGELIEAHAAAVTGPGGDDGADVGRVGRPLAVGALSGGGVGRVARR